MGNVASTHGLKVARGGRDPLPPGCASAHSGGSCCSSSLPGHPEGSHSLSSCPTKLQAFPTLPNSWGCFSAQGVLCPTSYWALCGVCGDRRARSLVDARHLVQVHNCTGICPSCHHPLSISWHRQGWAGLQVTVQHCWSPVSCLSHQSGT